MNKLSLKQAQEQLIAPWQDQVENLQGVRVFADKYAVTPGHLLFVPEYDDQKHRAMAFNCADLWGQSMVTNGDCDGYNIGLNHGTSAGQTVMYPHVHLIPRRTGDHDDPVGGVRAVIPGQANYKKSGYKTPNK
jgi:ATP adenylyltransferase